jgi:hypothetical protein
MTPRYTVPLLLMAGLILSGGGRREASVCSSAAGCLMATRGAWEPAETVARAAESVALGTTVIAAGTEPAAAGARAGLSSDGAAILAEQVAVQLVVKGAGLDLTPEQWATLAAVTGHYQTVRQTFEATIAIVSRRNNLRVEIPVYPAAGDALREKFFGELRERLGETTAEQIAQRAGGALVGYFGGFGVGVQTLDFSPGAGAAAGDYHVTRTARYWNNTEAREVLTLRCETYFPGLEDPTGERWAPFLALLANRGAE